MQARTFLFNLDSEFARVGEEKDIDDHGSIVGRLVETALIPRQEFDSRTSSLQETPQTYEFQARVKKREKYKNSAEEDENEYPARIRLSLSRQNQDYQIRDLIIERIY